MKTMIACLAVLLLAACATPIKPPNPVSAKSESGMVIVGTLSLGPCELSMAPYQTRIGVVAEKALRRLKDGRMSKDKVLEVERKATDLSATADAVCPLERDGRHAAAAHNRTHVGSHLPALEALVKESAR